jgi:hypothetical protein
MIIGGIADIKDVVEAVAAAAAVTGMVLGVLMGRAVPWLKAQYDRRSLRRRVGAEEYSPSIFANAVRHYIEPRCTATDPSGRESFRSVLPISRPLFKTLDESLSDTVAPTYLLLLADSGMGKTTALLNYHARSQRRLRRRPEIKLLNLGRDDVQAKIQAVENKSEKILFLDALDEDPLAIRSHRKRILDLMKDAREFRAVVLSCRSQFFRSEEEITRATGIAKIGATSLGDDGEYAFQKLYLAPFSDQEVRKFLRRRYPLWRFIARRRALEVVGRLADLSARPMLLAYIDDLLLQGLRLELLADVYGRIVEAWLVREKRFVHNLPAMYTFLNNLAVHIYSDRVARGGEHASVQEITQLAKQWGIDLEHWKLTGRSLLNRDAEGNYKFAHRSIMEYLFVRTCLAGDPRGYEVEWTDQMLNFASEMIGAQGSFRQIATSFVDTRGENLSRVQLQIISRLISDIAVRFKLVIPSSALWNQLSAFLSLCHLYVHRDHPHCGRSQLLALYLQDPDKIVAFGERLTISERRTIPQLTIESSTQSLKVAVNQTVVEVSEGDPVTFLVPVVVRDLGSIFLEYTTKERMPYHEKRIADLMNLLGIESGKVTCKEYLTWKDAVRAVSGEKPGRWDLMTMLWDAMD